VGERLKPKTTGLKVRVSSASGCDSGAGLGASERTKKPPAPSGYDGQAVDGEGWWESTSLPPIN
jgi:hypothetical protein